MLNSCLQSQKKNVWAAALMIACVMFLSVTLVGCGQSNEPTSSDSKEAIQSEDAASQDAKEEAQEDEASTEAQEEAASNDEASSDANTQPKPAASDESEFTGIWLPTYIRSYAGVEEDEESIHGYERIFETNCYIECADDQTATVSIPYRYFVSEWNQTDETHGTLLFLISDEADEEGNLRGGYLDMTLSDDKNTLNLALSADDAEDENQFIITCKRNTNKDFRPAFDNLSEYAKANDELYEEMPLDTDLPDSVIYEDDFVKLTLLGTTHDDESNSIGYWIEATNKFDDGTILGVTEFSPYFTVHGTETVGVYSRAIKPNTKRHIYLSFDKDAIDNNLADVHGTMMFMRYSGEEVTRATIDIQ
ncbi:MAG: hypothetical protein IKG18_08595 [Atopobiaceae bacterium]|nr:hypothetical protein [Atopobiaceae bacterium]